MSRILVVDDEKEICDLIQIYLVHEGYEVEIASDGMSALNILHKQLVDLVVLDIMLPDMDGITICRKVREFSQIPILMLSARREDTDKILGIMTGADDYMGKPFNPLELVVRIKAIMKRAAQTANEPTQTDHIVISNLHIIIAEHKVMLDDQEILLTVKEFDILKLLAENRGVVFSSETIYDRVWLEPFINADATIMTHIKNLREKLGDTARQPKYIKTVWGVGYKIEKETTY